MGFNTPLEDYSPTRYCSPKRVGVGSKFGDTRADRAGRSRFQIRSHRGDTAVDWFVRLSRQRLHDERLACPDSFIVFPLAMFHHPQLSNKGRPFFACPTCVLTAPSFEREVVVPMKLTYAILHHAPPHAALILGFLLVYSALVVYVRSTCWRDPTSHFFQPHRAHAPSYSTARIRQARQYADSAAKGRPEHGPRIHPPELCVGVPSVQREGISYLKATLGSLQHGLAEDERARLQFVVLLAHSNQTEHTDYGQPWLVNMADSLPSYHDDPDRLALARLMEANQTHAVKSKFDYSILMEECARTGAPYMLLVEDDVIFLDGWRHRAVEAMSVATMASWEAAHRDFLYLRLFYYEALLGWNMESWPRYTAWSTFFVAILLTLLHLTRRFVASTRRYLTRPVFLLTLGLFTPLLLLLFFTAGANCLFPQAPGVHLMPANACCGQGLVFPLSTVLAELLPLFRRNRWSGSPTDSFIEDYADASGGLRWALTPVLMQHVGSKSTYETRKSRYGNMTPSDIWNFAFETNDVGRLAEEHILANKPWGGSRRGDDSRVWV
ncbi:hypothetical protein E4U43_003661 [Claviceps pusilla]|uniref:Integral membrane protein n=1 Tax=Claviceps pusilla TaxID=123648 RepID=A0A9P7N6U4_9HYPO|nr:hypothetical protein E4U43_003661 [Claviceps pusilla]